MKHRKTALLCAAAALSLVLVAHAAHSRWPLLWRSFPTSLLRAAQPATVFAQGTTVLWSADMESNGNPGPDLGQWYNPACCNANNAGGGLFSSGAASAGPSFDYNHTAGGKYSAMLTISTPSTPTSGARLFRWMEPQTYPDLYYRAWYYFPQLYTPNGSPAFWNVFQWKSKHPVGTGTSVDPTFVLNVGETVFNNQNVMYFYLCPPPFDDIGGGPGNCVGQSAPFTFIPVGAWTHVEAHYVCATTPTGHVTIWEDGNQLFDFSNVETAYPSGDCQWSVNNYSNGVNPTPATIYVDDAAICSGGRCP